MREPLSDAGKAVLGSPVYADVLQVAGLALEMAMHPVLLATAYVERKPVGGQWSLSPFAGACSGRA